MCSKLTAAMLLTGLMVVPAMVWAETPLEAVETFYRAATTEGLCDEAIQIRPDYTHEQCEQFKTVNIRTLKLVKESETEAIVYLKMKYTTSASHRFSGYLHLYKDEDQWQIIGSDYRSRKAMSKSHYIKLFMGTAKKNKTADDAKKMVASDTLSGSHRSVLKRLEKAYPRYAKKHPIILIDVSEQELYLYVKRQLKRIYPISTAIKGEGNKLDSEQTPLGVHVIKKKIGKNAPLGTIFVDGESTHKVAEINRQRMDSPEEFVTSRVIILDGLEPGKNRGKAVDTRSRSIYIQGTNEEGLIGRKASHGSIRMHNKDIIKVFDTLAVGSLVYIGR